MAARRTGLDLPLPLQFLAGWLAVWLGRVLQEQVEYLKAESLLRSSERDAIELQNATPSPIAAA